MKKIGMNLVFGRFMLTAFAATPNVTLISDPKVLAIPISLSTSEHISAVAKKNRQIMSDALNAVGFVNYPTEYWQQMLLVLKHDYQDLILIQ
jgi:hypothetical protein